MNTQIIQDIKNRGIPPQFLSTLTHNWQKPDENQDPLKVDIKTHTGEVNRKTVSLWIPICNTSSSKSGLKFVASLKKNMKGQNLTKVLQCYAMENNILEGEAVQVLNINTRK